MDDLSMKTPEELLGDYNQFKFRFDKYGKMSDAQLVAKHASEILRELRSYRAMKAKAEEGKKHDGGTIQWNTGWQSACFTILSAGEEATK